MFVLGGKILAPSDKCTDVYDHLTLLKQKDKTKLARNLFHRHDRRHSPRQHNND